MTDSARAADECVWTRLPDIRNPLELRPIRVKASCSAEIAGGVHPFYPDNCPVCKRPVRVETMTEKPAAITFRPCPFCGGQPRHHVYVGYGGGRSFAWVECDPCHLRKELNCDGDDEASKQLVLGGVAHWWNRRSSEETRANPDEGFQARVYDWMAKCFMRPDSMLPAQRSFRFIEEALELVQASGTSREEVLRLVEYVYGRPPGIIAQEIGGVMVSLSGLATSFGLSMEYAGNAELVRCEENTEKIRAKDLVKPQRSPLPGNL